MSQGAKPSIGLSQVKRDLFARLTRKQRVGSGDRDRIAPRKQFSPCPLSFAQQRLWFMDQLEVGSTAYNIPMAVWLGGRLNTPALERSLNEVVRRHEVLRTSFGIDAEQKPVQIISPAQAMPLPVIDLRDVAPADREQEAARQATAEAQRPFTLQHGPLLRVTLLRFGSTEHVLLLTMHHIISDGWSMSLLIGEIATLYQAFFQGQASPLSELSIQYADFARWQRDWLQGDVLEEQMAYWREQLAGELPVLDLPTDYPRPQQQGHQGARQTFTLSAELTESLKHLSRREGVTLFMTLLAGFETLLYRYSGQEEIVIGAPLANRNRPEIEELIGFFVNTLVLRIRLRERMTFGELLAQVREVTLSAYTHQDVPFEKLVEELQPQRDTSHTPLFQVIFSWQNDLIPPPQLPGLTVKNLEVELGTAKFDLVLNLHDTGRELTGVMAYNTDLFEANTIARLLTHFQNLLASIVAQPSAPIKTLDLLTPQEKLILDKTVEVAELSESFSF